MVNEFILAWIVIIIIVYVFYRMIMIADEINQSSIYNTEDYYDVFEDPNEVVNKQYVVYKNGKRQLGYGSHALAVESIKDNTKLFNAINGSHKQTFWRINDEMYKVKTFRIFLQGNESQLETIDNFIIVYE